MDEEKNELTPAEPEKKPAPQNIPTMAFLRILVCGYVCYLGISMLPKIFSGEETRIGLIIAASLMILGGGGFALYTVLTMVKKK